jgi:hypothetical protein
MNMNVADYYKQLKCVIKIGTILSINDNYYVIARIDTHNIRLCGVGGKKTGHFGDRSLVTYDNNLFNSKRELTENEARKILGPCFEEAIVVGHIADVWHLAGLKKDI